MRINWNFYNVSLCLDELKTAILRFDMLDIFTILFPINPKSSKYNPVTKMIMLLDNFLSVTVEEVGASNRHYRHYQENYCLKKLYCILKLLLHSSDAEL